MVQPVPVQLFNRHQQAAQELLQVSKKLEQVYLDQYQHIGAVTAEDFFQIANDQVHIAGGKFKIRFDIEKGLIFQSNPHNLDSLEVLDTTLKSVKLAETESQSLNRFFKYLCEDTYFYTLDSYEIHPTDLKTKTQILRQTLVEQVFEWIDGENRVEQYLYNINEEEAQKIDDILQQYSYFDYPYVSDFAKYGKAIPLSVEINIKHLVLINSVLGQSFLPVNALMNSIHQFSFKLEKIIPAHYLRIIKIFYNEHVSLDEIQTHLESFKLLSVHAQEKPQLLAFAKRMNRGFWQYQDLFNKQHFLNGQGAYWSTDAVPTLQICTLKRTVNWLFKQDPLVNDWISLHIKDINVRTTMIALSFMDTSKVYPEVILMTLQYFKRFTARLFLMECHSYAITNEWQSAEKNTKYVLLPTVSPHKNSKRVITDSFLYIEEWLDFSALMLADHEQQYKKMYSKITRVVQAFMMFLQNIAMQLPRDLVKFIDPQKQQHAEFFIQLKKHNIQVEDFRKNLKHINQDRTPSISIYDSYVSDYIVHMFIAQHEVKHNLTWSGLYQQAKRWHEQNYLQEALDQLKQDVGVSKWERVTPMQKIYFEDWCYEELNSLKRIIQESMVYKHCLALSYTSRIVEREYVAFHMSKIDDPSQEFTLGCYYSLGELSFDQLRLPNNHESEQHFMLKALRFIHDVNQHLKWQSSIQPNEELKNL